MWLKRHRVNKLIEKQFRKGMWARLGGLEGPTRGLEYSGVPGWYNEVADIAYAAGWRWMDASLYRLNEGTNVWSREPKITPRVYADCYAAAGLMGRVPSGD